MRREDEGFTLVELIVALAVISVAMAGVGSFFVTSNSAVSNQRDQRQAIQVAAGAIEQVRGLKGSSLLAGRGPVKVKAQWDKVLAGVYRTKVKRYLDSMLIGSDPEITDPASTAGASAAIPTDTQTIKIGSVSYQRDIIVGRCEIYFMRNDDCVNPSIGTPPANSAEILKYFRVVVLVTWTAKNCKADSCSHIASTLIASESEPTFDSKAAVPQLITTDMWFYVNAPQQPASRLDVDHGQQPNTWSWGPTKPAWLSISATTGLVTGTPTAVADVSSTVTVTDSLGRSDTGTVIWHAVRQPTITVPTSSSSIAGSTVSLTVTGADGIPPLSYKARRIDDGLELDPKTGIITGKIDEVGSYPVRIQVEDSKGQTADASFTHTVIPYEPVTLTVPTAQQVDLGTPVSLNAVAAKGDLKYTYVAVGLPNGMTINTSTGVISGTPAAAGRYLPQITVRDGVGRTATGSFELVVNSTVVLNFTAPALFGADQTTASGATVNLPVRTNALGVAVTAFTIDATGLPPGLGWNAAKDAIIGSPTTRGTYSVTITATGKLRDASQTAVLTMKWTVT